jgi:hypothetical protein
VLRLRFHYVLHNLGHIRLALDLSLYLLTLLLQLLQLSLAFLLELILLLVGELGTWSLVVVCNAGFYGDRWNDVPAFLGCSRRALSFHLAGDCSLVSTATSRDLLVPGVRIAVVIPRDLVGLHLRVYDSYAKYNLLVNYNMRPTIVL